jgi:hypothetical protein
MRALTPSRLTLALLISAILFLTLPCSVRAQDETGDAPLGDVARSLRKKSAPSDAVIDNDNLPKVMENAESLHATGSSPVFSLDPGGKSFRVSSPDVSCSLSFTAKTASLLSDPLMLDELPRTELAKLDGPASIDGDSLQVSVHNGSAWELREVVIGLTILRRVEPGEMASYPGQARIVPAAGGSSQMQDSPQKQPDVTLLLRVKGSAAPSTTAIFRTSLNFALFPDQDWHWAIVKAKGVPPQIPPEEATPQPEPGVGLPAATPGLGTRVPPSPPFPSNADAAAR